MIEFILSDESLFSDLSFDDNSKSFLNILSYQINSLIFLATLIFLNLDIISMLNYYISYYLV